MTQEASPLVRAKCAGRFSRWSLFEILRSATFYGREIPPSESIE